MAANVSAIITEVVRIKWTKVDLGLEQETHSKLKYFKIGEGGWIDEGAGKVPREPLVTQTDLDCIEHPENYPEDSRYFYQKDFRSEDLSFEQPITALIRCFLDFDEANNANGSLPSFWELGVFDEDDTLVIYGTFEEIIKTEEKQINQEVRLIR
jgi:hypothetical protein